jgi:gamma-glutamylaminecyclotransferase
MDKTLFVRRPQMTHLVFVFGTLKEGFPNFATNKGTRVPGSFVTTECYPLYLVGERHSPWLINMPGEGKRIYGQVFQVDDDALAAMDKLERIHEPDGYRRVLLEVQSNDTLDSSVLSVFAYLITGCEFSGVHTLHTLAVG